VVLRRAADRGPRSAEQSKSVQLILSDINMPSMDGLEFLRQIRAQNLAPGVPVVMITTESSEEHVKQAILPERRDISASRLQPSRSRNASCRCWPRAGRLIDTRFEADSSALGRKSDGVEWNTHGSRPVERRPKEMESTMTQSLRENLHLVSDPRNLDSSVDEVFHMMLGVSCYPTGGIRRGERDDYSGGRLRRPAERRLRLPLRQLGGLIIAAKLTGMEFAEIDDTVKDAIGEVCNMLAGAWKGRVPIFRPTAACRFPR
jgi:CheY-like chemotaxis protein